MAWWRKQSAQTPRSRWNQDDSHTAVAANSKAQIEQGVSPWQKLSGTSGKPPSPSSGRPRPGPRQP